MIPSESGSSRATVHTWKSAPAETSEATVLKRKLPGESFKAKNPKTEVHSEITGERSQAKTQTDVVKRKFPSEAFPAKDPKRQFRVDKSKGKFRTTLV